MSAEDFFEWKLVTKGRKVQMKHGSQQQPDPVDPTDVPRKKQQFSESLSELSEYREAIEPWLHDALKQHNISQCDVAQIVCYGVGQFYISVASRYQLALLCLFKEFFPKAKCCCYEPVLSAVEKGFLEDLCVSVQPSDNAKHCDHDITIFYMPHCPWELYNNLLWANWSEEQLQRTFIVGNSFQDFVSNALTKTLETFRYVDKVVSERMVSEFPFPVLPLSTDNAFTDLAFLSFCTEDCASSIWSCCDEPLYPQPVS